MQHSEQSTKDVDNFMSDELRKLKKENKELMKREHNSAVLVVYQLVKRLETKITLINTKITDLEIKCAQNRFGIDDNLLKAGELKEIVDSEIREAKEWIQHKVT